MLLLFLFGTSFAAWADDHAECITDDFLANGYLTGQNIDMNYDASDIRVENNGDGNPETHLHLEFLVPRRYVDQYEANSYALTFNRQIGAEPTLPQTDDYNEATGSDDGTDLAEDWMKQVRMYVGQFKTPDDTYDQSACFSNRRETHGNYTFCDTAHGAVENLWTETVQDDNPCMFDVSADIPWSNVMGTAFGGQSSTGEGMVNDGGVVVNTNGNWIEIFLTATVETWTHFSQGKTNGDYLGVMTGGESLKNTNGLDAGNDDLSVDLNRKGEYSNDAGWLGWPNEPEAGEFGDIVIDDERYTLYQIPFILRFPRTVMVETSFVAMTDFLLLSGVVAQDVINVNLNPTDGDTSDYFAELEVTLTTQIQYPYGIVAPDVDTSNTQINAMTVIAGSDPAAAAEGHASAVKFVTWTDPAACMDSDQYFADEGTCEQDFKIRITPNNDSGTGGDPCSVAGDYTFEMWATCVGAKPNSHADGDNHERGCPIDDLATNASLDLRRQSNAYFTQTINIQHQPFCPVLMDEVRVVGDFRVYKDEQFETLVDNDQYANGAFSGTDSWKSTVFTNDKLFFEATYRTASVESGETGTFNNNGDVADLEQDNAVNEYGNDSIIDFVRPTKIFMDVTLGKDRSDAALSGWDSDYNSNFENAYNDGSRIPDASWGEAGELTVEAEGDGSHSKYNIVLCEVAPHDPSTIRFSDIKPDVCFTQTKSIARDFLDFNIVMRAREGFTNTIDENEVAFAMRMDERILPVYPSSDDSFATVTIQAEVYYKGNRHATSKTEASQKPDADQFGRRRLQDAPETRSQALSLSVGYSIVNSKRLRVCTVSDEESFGAVMLKFQFDSLAAMPSAGDMAAFTADLSMQFDHFLKARGAVKVERVERCNGDCRAIYARKNSSLRRRTEEEEGFFLNVYLTFENANGSNAGRILNVFQGHVVDRRDQMHSKVAIFSQSKVVKMEVDGCNGVALGIKQMAPRAFNSREDYKGTFDDTMNALNELKMGDEEDYASAAMRPTALLTLAFAAVLALW